MREIVLDTETTGFDPKTGDRLIEIGCIELNDLLPTGRTFHRLVNPERLIPPEATRVHGITDAQVKDAPKFHDIVQDFLEFIGDAPLIAHNANFDRNFIDFEFSRFAITPPAEERWIDTLQLAQKRFPGMPNSLDALCKRFKISLVDRTLHGALIDSRLLAEVYLELRGGKERALDLTAVRTTAGAVTATGQPSYPPRPRPLAPLSTPQEHGIHREFLKTMLKDHSLWAAHGVIVDQGQEVAA
ncbi:DNA polymerase III subunit epsilon [Brevundimonas vesicularis]|uniref:DNA polymerase III subunit epsilon n=1 Tax=Brevundimonas vesicularis TaxID=41276 RepID=UPI0038D460E2